MLKQGRHFTAEEFDQMVGSLRDLRKKRQAKADKGGLLRGWHQRGADAAKRDADSFLVPGVREQLVKSAEYVYELYEKVGAPTPEKARLLKERREAAAAKAHRQVQKYEAKSTARRAGGVDAATAEKMDRAQARLRGRAEFVSGVGKEQQAPANIPEQYREQAKKDIAKQTRQGYRGLLGRGKDSPLVRRHIPENPAAVKARKAEELRGKLKTHFADQHAAEAKAQQDFVDKAKARQVGGTQSAASASKPPTVSAPTPKPETPTPKPDASTTSGGGSSTSTPDAAKPKPPPKTPSKGLLGGMKPGTKRGLLIGGGVATGLAGLAAIRSATAPKTPPPPKMAGLAALIWK